MSSLRSKTDGHKRIKLTFFMEGSVIIDVPSSIDLYIFENDISTYENSNEELYTYLQNKYNIILVADENEVDIDSVSFDELIVI